MIPDSLILVREYLQDSFEILQKDEAKDHQIIFSFNVQHDSFQNRL